MLLTAKAFLSGLATWLPGYPVMRRTGGTDSARYCYSVWLRHLVLLHASGRMRERVPRVVAELGPGDSIGIGIAALLSGAEKYYAFDVVRYSDLSRVQGIFDELVQMFVDREPVPGKKEFPSLNPGLDSYAFPHQLLDEDSMRAALSIDRIAAIRAAIDRAGDADSMIRYQAPWNDPSSIPAGSVDLIFSQAVLEHVDELEQGYAAMRRWLKPGGLMSHQIDFKCHRKADTWNGHWTYSDFAWKVVVGRRTYLLNRAPHSTHVSLMERAGFEVVCDVKTRSESRLRRSQLSARYRSLSDDDLTTSGAYIVAAAR